MRPIADGRTCLSRSSRQGRTAYDSLVQGARRSSAFARNLWTATGGLNSSPIFQRPSVSGHQFGCWRKLVAEAVPTSDVLAREKFQVWSIDRSLDHRVEFGRLFA